MEIFAQYLDDLDDLVFAAGLCAERVRRLLLFVLSAVSYTAIVASGVWLGLQSPIAATAVVTSLALLLVYRATHRAPIQRTPL